MNKYYDINSYKGNLRGNTGYTFRKREVHDQKTLTPHIRNHMDMSVEHTKKLKHLSVNKSSGNPTMMGGAPPPPGFEVKFEKGKLFVKPVAKPFKITRPKLDLSSKYDNINSYKGNLRGNIGYAYKKNLMSDALYVKPHIRAHTDMRIRNLTYLSTYKAPGNPTMMGGRGAHYNDARPMQYGSGIVDTISAGVTSFGVIAEALDKVKTVGKVLYDVYGSEKASQLKNVYTKFLDKNPEAKTGYGGERHVMLPTQYGWSMGNWCGPGTNVKDRLKRGDIGVDGLRGIDMQCKKHDLEYTKAKTIKDIRNADTNLVRNIDKSTGKSYMKRSIKALLRAKMLGEDVGILDPKSFTTFPSMEGEGKHHKMKNLLKIKLRNESNYEGMGNLFKKKIKKKYPGQLLKKKLSKKYYNY